MPQEEYDVTFFLPTSAADAFPTPYNSTVSEFFWQVYGNALSWTQQEYGEELAVIIRLENYPLGPFLLPFKQEEETERMREMTVAEFYELLWRDWREAFRILPAGVHARLDAFLASNAEQQLTNGRSSG